MGRHGRLVGAALSGGNYLQAAMKSTLPPAVWLEHERPKDLEFVIRDYKRKGQEKDSAAECQRRDLDQG